MENMYLQIGAAVVLLLTSVAGWFKAHSEIGAVVKDREATKIDRDAEFHALKERMLKTEFQCLANKENADLLFSKYDDLGAQIKALVVELAKATTELASTNRRLDGIIKNG